MNRDNVVKFNTKTKNGSNELGMPLLIKSAAEVFYNNSEKNNNLPQFLELLHNEDWKIFMKNRIINYPRRVVATLVLYLIINLLGESNLWFVFWAALSVMMQTIDALIYRYVGKKDNYIRFVPLVSISIIISTLVYNSYILVLWLNYGHVASKVSSIILLVSWGVGAITLNARVQSLPKLYFSILIANFFWPIAIFIFALFDNYKELNISWSVLSIVCLIICSYVLAAINESYKNSIERKEALLKAIHNEELAKKANEAKSFFISNLSHELRTPMSAILGSAQLLSSNKNFNSQDKELISTMISSGNAMVRLLNELLDNAKIEADKVDIEEMNFSVKTLLSDLKSLWLLNANSKNVDVILDINEDVPNFLIGDKFRISQILNNFCSNSFKFTSKGSIKISASYEDGKLIVSVADTGKGISCEEFERLFVPFSQADSSISRLHGGTGLGLYNSLKLAQIMNGDISVESVKGKYSKFSLILPLEIGDSEDDDNINLDFDKTEINILLADDNVASRLILNRYLELAGANITMVNDGANAVEEAKNKKYSIILLDVRMPILNGIEACKQIRNDSLNIHTPIIMVSAEAAGGDIMSGINAGANYYLSKPIDAKKLFKIIEIVLSSVKETEAIIN